MLKYVVNRLLSLIPVILVTSFLIYWAMSLTEGDPAMMIAGDGASKEMIDQIRHELGLDQPFLLQYFNYMRGDVYKRQARTGFAYQTQSTFFADSDINAVDSMYIAVFCFIMDHKVLNI